jgi:hypothetical protein
MQLDNGSRIISLPGSERTVRGYSAATLVVVDEASRVEDEMLSAVRPMLATTNGRFFGLSTPNGKRGWWWEAWKGGENWERIQVRASECSRISREYLEQELAFHGPLKFSQEYECQFVDTELSVFSTQLIQQALVDDFEPFLAV